MRRCDIIFQCPFFKGTTEYDRLMKEVDDYIKGYLNTDYEIMSLQYTNIITSEQIIYPANMYKIQIKLNYEEGFSLNDMQHYESMIVEKLQKIIWEVH